jgi:hypothetical protein
MWSYSGLRQHIRTNIPILCNPWLRCIYHTMATYHLPLTDGQTTWEYNKRTLCPSSFYTKNSNIGSGAAGYISLEKIFQVFQPRIFKTLQLFVINSKRLGGYNQWVRFFAQHSRIF